MALLSPTPTATVRPSGMPESLRGKIVFWSDRLGDPKLFVMDPACVNSPDGCGAAVQFWLTQDYPHRLGWEEESLSPDRQARLLVQPDTNQILQIFKKDLASGQVNGLTAFEKGSSFDPAWSPRGDTIAFVPTESGNDGTFADKLRAILRLDPDIVMVGEIRDNDTAKTALQASLTGHLVLATFHASSASAALTRLSDIIGQNPLFVSAIRLVMAQRLIRQLDENTKQPYQPSQSELATIQKVIDTLPPSMARPNLAGLQLYKPVASPENPYGFKGQIAIREQIVMTAEIRKLLEVHDHVLSMQEIEEAAIKSGMRTMLQDAMLHVVAGRTTLEEIFRVVG